MYNYHKDGTQPKENQIFVFGSNESGIHGAGAALAARKLYGAQLGIGFGPTGESWAIPTKNWNVESMNLGAIKHYIDRFKVYVETSTVEFFITRIGCGLAGYADWQIAPLFKGINSNCDFPEEWKQYLESHE